MMKNISLTIIALILATISYAANDIPPQKYNDGPYILIEDDKFVTYTIVEGELIAQEVKKDAPLTVELPRSKKVVLDPAAAFEASPSTIYLSDEPIVAISDVHGQYNIFEQLLQSNKVIDDELNWTFGKGNLVIVGDVMDRGDMVLECLWLIYHLEEQAKAAGGKVHFLLGNHELMVMNGRLDYLHKKYLYTSALFKRPYHTLFGPNTFLGQWLKRKSVILQINDKLFVHGGLSQQAMTLGLNIDEINTAFREKLYYKSVDEIQATPELSTLYYENGPLWYRGYAFPYSFNKTGIDSLMTALNLSNIIVGHTSLPKIKGLYGNRIVLIDSSIKLGETGEILLIDKDQFSVGKMDGSLSPLISEESKVEDRKSLFNNLYGQEKVFINISTSTEDILNRYEKEKLATDGQVTITFGGEQLTFSAHLKPGGKTRRKICSNPPIKIDLNKAELENFNFLSDFDKLKVVFQCNDMKVMAQSIKMEKFIYDLHNIVTPYSHEAKLINAKTSSEKKYLNGLLLESREDLGLRTGITELEVSTISTDVIDREEYVKMCLFQYMIANTDWSARKMHNSKLYKKNEEGTYITIPYDFDYAGIINNEYAVTSEKLPITRVTQRYFMDKKISLEELNKGITYFLSIEKDIIALCQEVAYLSDNTKTRVDKFIHNFYKIIKDEKLVARMLKK